MKHPLTVGTTRIGAGAPLVLIAGPCVIEDEATTFGIAAHLRDLTRQMGIPFVFKASYDKANRTSIQSYRGPGAADGLKLLARIRSELGVQVISDVHRIGEVAQAAEVLDIIQIPAFLCRQTDLIVEVARTRAAVNVKKGQFLSPWDMRNVVDKIASAGNHRVMITERGSMFGYNNLVVDFRGIAVMQALGCPVIFDATHSVQLPGGSGGSSGGQREFAPVLARAAVAAGADGVFMEVHPSPERALCDGPNSLRLDSLPALLSELKAIRSAMERTKEAAGRPESGRGATR